MPKLKHSIQNKQKKSSSLKLSRSPYVKVAISMPGEDLLRIEKVCEQLNLSRSKFMLIAVHQWFEAPKKQSLIDQYIRGYERVPEDTADIKLLEAIQSQALDKETW
jgi:hypothetical protein